MKNPKRISKSIFYILLAIFILIVLYFVIPSSQEIRRVLFPVIAVLGIIFFILGGILIFTAWKLKGKLRLFLILTGASALCVLISVLLHNFVYGLFIYLFGEGFWQGGDEAFFFIIALFVCPIVFLIGVIGTLMNLRK